MYPEIRLGEVKNPGLWESLIDTTGKTITDIFGNKSGGKSGGPVVVQKNPDYTVPIIAAAGILGIALILTNKRRRK